MSDKIKIRYVGGDDCEHLESRCFTGRPCKTWDDLSAEMESVVQFVTLKHSLTPRVIFEGVDGKNYEATIEFRAIKQEYDEEDADDAVIEALSKVLTKEMADEWLETDGFIYGTEYYTFESFNRIEADAAKLLIEHENTAGGFLYFSENTMIDSETESIFLSHKGKINDMNPKEWIESLKK